MEDRYNNPDNGNAYEQPQYQQPNIQEQLQYSYQQPNTELEEPITMGEWLITLLIMMIPCVNIIMMFVWAFSSNEKKSKSNYFKAALIVGGIALVLYIILILVVGASMAAMTGMNY